LSERRREGRKKGETKRERKIFKKTQQINHQPTAMAIKQGSRRVNIKRRKVTQKTDPVEDRE
jgi:hypothetical protein